MTALKHCADFMLAVARTAEELANFTEQNRLDDMAKYLNNLRARRGRLFILGVGGGAANASHAVNDFRKLCGIEAYAPTDNVAEFSARVNDEGVETTFVEWLRTNKMRSNDAIFVFSVGGGTESVSRNISTAVGYAKGRGVAVLGVVGRSDGLTAKHGTHVVVVPHHSEALLTPLTEAFQMVVLHCLVSHPNLQVNATKW